MTGIRVTLDPDDEPTIIAVADILWRGAGIVDLRDHEDCGVLSYEILKALRDRLAPTVDAP